MLLTNKSSLKSARRHLRRFNVMSVLLCLMAFGAGSVVLFQGDKFKGALGDLVYDTSALFLSLVESPFNDIEGYKQNLKRHLYLQKNAQDLERILSQLKTYQNKTQSLEMRNAELRDLLSLQGTGGQPFITAPCFGQHSFLKGHSLFIHAGQNSGIQRFDVALSEGAIVGQVDQVGGKTSRILLINDGTSRIPVTLELSKKEAVLSGSESGELYLDFIKNPQELKLGELVFSSGVDGYFPRGKPLGKVIGIRGQKAVVAPLVDIRSMRYVQVQKSHGGEVQ